MSNKTYGNYARDAKRIVTESREDVGPLWGLGAAVVLLAIEDAKHPRRFRKDNFDALRFLESRGCASMIDLLMGIEPAELRAAIPETHWTAYREAVLMQEKKRRKN